ncbi:hypothetical protein, partial [Rhizobium leguminosarum]|uniref:hypothetical protein n=1 Tax=Rhizobium leguminosarum TaxID=384 RepID=UPI003F9530FA
PDRASPVLVMSNFTPVPRYVYRIGVPSDGVWIGRIPQHAEDGIDGVVGCRTFETLGMKVTELQCRLVRVKAV